MEVELKYLIPDKEIIGNLWQENVFRKYGSVDSQEQIEMKAVYYDTEDQLLASVDTAFRIRQEGNLSVATIKWNGMQSDSLYEREELNLPLADTEAPEHPSLDVFAESEKGRELIELVGDKPLKPNVITAFTRKLMRVDTGCSICEIALDVGEIITSAGNLDICELEIELFSGELDDINDMGKDLAERFGLKSGVMSKYGRGMDLLKGK